MAKNFRFHDGKNVFGWDNSSPYTKKEITAIKDPDGANANREITSIPSPFARIDLIKNAFLQVADTSIEGDTIYHKMVSDALDIAEIFYNYDKYKNDIDIIAWDPIVDLNKLLSSENESHQLLGKTLDLYLNQDAATYNFTPMGKLYLLNYKHGVNPLNIIGGTSPASLFFTSANTFDLTGFVTGNRQFLGNTYTPLHKRDNEFIKFIYALKQIINNFTAILPSLEEYLTETRKLLSSNLRSQINSIDANYYNNLPDLSIDGGNQVVDILGYPLKKSKGNASLISQLSDFRITSPKNLDGLSNILVLPIDTISGNLRYVTHTWDSRNKAPKFEDTPISNRVLPFDGTPYPYITISDLLEPVIIRTSFPINDKYFDKAGYTSDNNGYLLPLKPLFFDLFNLGNLDDYINGEKVFEIKGLSNNNVEVVLRLPIQQGKHITYKRIYTNPVNKGSAPSFNEDRNQGAVIDSRINLGITPFYKFPGNITPEYNIGFYDAEFSPLMNNVNYKLDFFNNDNSKIQNLSTTQRRYKEEENVDMHAYIVNSNFDYIQLSNKYASGILIPKLQETINNGSDKFNFAIDFGTTNTHIEYQVNESAAQPFEFTNRELFHIGSLFDKSKISEEKYDVYLGHLNDDLLPKLIGDNSSHKFPQRTVSAYHNRMNFAQPVFSMANITIPFKYEQASFALNTKIKTNLKWDTGQNSIKIMNSFFEELIKMIRNKILLNNGSLAGTKIVWSYPASMLQFQLNQMKEEWSKLITKYLGTDVNIVSVCESLTPFYYYTNVEGKSALAKPMITLDIGGGTSDVAVFDKNQPILFSSYKFAGDAIFGDNYNRNINLNGYIKRYHDKLKSVLGQNELMNLPGILDSIKATGNSNDVINAYFSLETNKALKNSRAEINFLDNLKNDSELKIVFLLFYVAQIYHIAKLFNKREIDAPGGISFSGTASKLLNILDATSNKETLSNLTNKVFEHVLENAADVKVELILADNPKELTCKGALYMDTNIDLNEIKEVLVTDDLLLSESNATYGQVESLETKTMRDYEAFLDFFFILNKSINFKGAFGIESTSVNKTKEILNDLKEQAFKVGVQKKLDELDNPNQEIIAETLFFYPLTGSLGELAYELINQG